MDNLYLVNTAISALGVIAMFFIASYLRRIEQSIEQVVGDVRDIRQQFYDHINDHTVHRS